MKKKMCIRNTHSIAETNKPESQTIGAHPYTINYLSWNFKSTLQIEWNSRISRFRNSRE